MQGANPVSVKVTLRGKKYDVKDATSVEDVQKSVEEQAGLAKEQQVMFFGVHNVRLLNSMLHVLTSKSTSVLKARTWASLGCFVRLRMYYCTSSKKWELIQNLSRW